MSVARARRQPYSRRAVPFSGRFGGYGYGFGHGGIGVIGLVLIILVVLPLMGKL